jgi:hypothetical protein
MFKNGDATIGASWPYQESAEGRRRAGRVAIPAKGATGWADVDAARRRPAPNCAYCG